MTEQELRARILGCLARVAPEVEGAAIRPSASLREEADLDSMDFLRFVVALGQAFGVEVPEADYPAISTLEGCARYLAARLPGSPAPGP